MKNLLFLLPLLALLSACHKEKAAAPTQTVQARYSYTGAADSPAASDALIRISSDNTVLKLSRADLYLSNVKLVREDGSVWSEPDSYHLLRLPTAAAGRGTLTLKNVPYGTYTGITFSFGVDEAHNHSLDNPGDLDPANGMAWDWNTGYRFLVMEGRWGPNGSADSAFLWHIGSDANYRTKTVSLGSPLLVQSDTVGTLAVRVNMAAFFYGTHTLAPSRYHDLMDDITGTAQAADNILSAVSIQTAGQ